jgi:hypothetical protein
MKYDADLSVAMSSADLAMLELIVAHTRAAEDDGGDGLTGTVSLGLGPVDVDTVGDDVDGGERGERRDEAVAGQRDAVLALVHFQQPSNLTQHLHA